MTCLADGGWPANILPIDSGRYGSAEMREIFSERRRYQRFLDVEVALASSQARLGMIPEPAAGAIAAHGGIDGLLVERVRELEAETRHELVAVIRAFGEAVPEYARFIHYGATSSDILDTATALQMKDALILLRSRLAGLIGLLLDVAESGRDWIMLGRTHGQHALPITFGFKVANWTDELLRHLERLDPVLERVAVGKMSGAVGSMAGFGELGPAVQEQVMAQLGLRSSAISTQIVHRDRIAEFVLWTAMVAGTLEAIATEVRNLQRPEIGEVAESFDVGRQYGSSTMAHKHNPVVAENICSLARIVRSLVVPALETLVLWHERDLTNSAVERFTIPEAAILTDDMLVKAHRLVASLEVSPARMAENLAGVGTAIFAETIMLTLVARGKDRTEAYRALQRAAEEARRTAVPFASAAGRHAEISSLIPGRELSRLLTPEANLGHCGPLTDAVIAAGRRRLAETRR